MFFWRKLLNDVAFTHQFRHVEDVRCGGTDAESAGQTRHRLLRGCCHLHTAVILCRKEWSNGATDPSFQCLLETRKTCFDIPKASVWSGHTLPS